MPRFIAPNAFESDSLDSDCSDSDVDSSGFDDSGSESESCLTSLSSSDGSERGGDNKQYF